MIINENKMTLTESVDGDIVEHFKKVTGVNIQPDGASYIAVGISQSRLRNVINKYNKEYGTNVRDHGIDSRGALVVSFQ